jgi:DNA-binding CsgD family transcriptional regulator
MAAPYLAIVPCATAECDDVRFQGNASGSDSDTAAWCAASRRPTGGSRFPRGPCRGVARGRVAVSRISAARPTGIALARQDPYLPIALLTRAFGLALWVASGSFVLAVAGGLGPHPVKRVIVGALLVLLWAAALRWRRAASALLRSRPAVVCVLGAAELALAAVDGLPGTPYAVVSLTAVGLAVIVARTRTVWLCVLLLDVAYAALVLASYSPDALGRSGELGGVIGAIVSYPFVALILLCLRRLFHIFVADADRSIEGLRRDPTTVDPPLARAIQWRGRQQAALPPGPSRLDRLTGAEHRAVLALATGLAPKELAHQLGVSLTTVRTHIRNAKRKTGARTLRELVAMAVRERSSE